MRLESTETDELEGVQQQLEPLFAQLEARALHFVALQQ